MTDRIKRSLRWLGKQLPDQLSFPGDDRYATATAIWAKPVGPLPRAVIHCRSAGDVQAAVRAARDGDLPLAVRGGGHDWAGRALCDGLVIDLTSMNGVEIDSNRRAAQIAGGARTSDVVAMTDPLGLAVVTGSAGAVGMAGLTLGGGYGPLIARYGLALDNLIAAEVILANGNVVTASHDCEEELFWALRGGGGNFGVVITMRHRLHELSRVRSGIMLFPFSEAKSVLEGSVDIAAAAPDELTVQLGFLFGPDGSPVVMLVPTWSGLPEEGEARLSPFFQLGTVVMSTVDTVPYGASLGVFDAHIVNGQRVLMETSWLPALNGPSIDALIEAIANAASPGCAIITHEFRGAATRVAEEATAFGLRRDHILIEIIASFAGDSDFLEERRHRLWVQTTRHALDPMALPGGYPNLLVGGDGKRIAESYGGNVGRLIEAKQGYDPDNIFNSAIPLPVGHLRAPGLSKSMPR